MAISPAGNSARSRSAAGIVPVWSNARIFSCRVLPMPGSSTARPSRASAATDTDASRTALAPLRYASTRWTIGAIELVQVAELLERFGDRIV